MKHYKYIIIGGGVAGVTCAEQLCRFTDENSKVLLISARDFVKIVTNVECITKTLYKFDVTESSITEFEKDFKLITVVRAAVKELDSKNKVVKTNEENFKYDKLCICSGGLPNHAFPENPYMLYLRDTESAKNFQQKIANAQRIVIIGNGGIATEIVYEVGGIEVIWAIKDKFINSVFIDAGAAEFLKSNLDSEEECGKSVTKRQKFAINSFETNDGLLGGALGPDWHSDLNLYGKSRKAVTIETEVLVKRILLHADMKMEELTLEEKQWPVYVELSNGKFYGCDFIVSATGVVPNTEVFMKGNEFKLGAEKGLLVNDKMETSISDVYAAGDACSVGWDVASHWFQFRLWSQARQMGAYAAKSMWSSLNSLEVDLDFCFEMFSHSTKFLGHKVVLLGLFNGQKLDSNFEILLRVTKCKEYIKCVISEGKMKGAILIGETGLEETFENLILNQIDISMYGEDLLDPSVDIEDYFD